MQKGKFNCVVDSAWGSSAKGAASTRLAAIYEVPHISSGNYPNAGHTAIVDGKKFVAKAIPTAAILEPKRDLWIGPNSGFNIEQFKKEISQTNTPMDRVHIHERAMIVEQRHIDSESPHGAQSTERVSSTMSGSGAALTEKAMRKPEVKLAKEMFPNSLPPMVFVRNIREKLKNNEMFLHEVSQGFALSLNHGTHYPFCTSRDCTPQQTYSDFGILPSMVGDVYLNVRTFPIRVGNNFRNGVQTGYSGDFMPDQTELSWEQIGREAEMPQSEIDILAEKERTTVTKKIRRVASFSWQLLQESAEFCGATKLILNFPQYIHWSSYKMFGGKATFQKIHPKIREFIDKMESTTNLRVTMIGTGPEHNDHIFLD
jgi:adenylosuccinate synthase